MRLSDIIIETEEVSELNINATSAGNSNDKPQNFLSRLKTNLQQVHPFNSNTRARAKGIKQLGKSANEVMKQYQTFLGTSGMSTPTLGHLTGWMQQQGLPLTGRVDALIKQVQSSASPTPTTDPAATPQPTAAPAATQGADNQVAQQPGAATPPPTGGKLTPQQIAAKKAEIQGKRAAGQTTASQTGSGFSDFVKAGGTKLTGANPDGSPKFTKVREDAGNDLPLDNKMVSQIISAAVAEKNSKTSNTVRQASRTGNQSTAAGTPTTGTSTSGGTGGGSVNRSSNGQQAPAINTAAVVAYYKKLDQNGRKALRTQLDQADAELAKTQQTQSVDPVNEQVGYSRFLGMSL